MMKRAISLLLVLLLTLTMLAACGSEKQPAGTQAPETEPTPADRPISLGVLDGNTYTNAYAGIGCSLESNWTILPADELQELPGIVAESMEGTELGEALKDVQQITDMYAVTNDQLCNMNLLLQKMSLQERLAYMFKSEGDIIDEALSQKDAMIEAYASAGINVSTMEKVKVTYLGEEHFALKTVAETQGIGHYILQVFNYGIGEYSVTLTMTSFLEDNTESMLEQFYAVE